MQLNGMIVGLGNPGPEYERTRHNFGFMLVDKLLETCAQAGGPPDKLSPPQKNALLWRCRLAGNQTWLALKPLTYMNKSGEAVAPVAAYYRLATENILVVQDELDLPFGQLRFKQGGGSAGHKGINSIAQILGSQDFFRLRLGIGKTAAPETNGHVLGRFSPGEAALIPQIIAAALEGLQIFLTQGFIPARQFWNSFSLPVQV